MVPIFHHKIWLLFLGDLLLIVMSTWYAPWIRGWRYEVFELETGASLFTILLYLLMLYVFDLYNVQRVDFINSTAIRMTTAVGMSGLFSTVLFYSIPQWRFGRSIFLIQILLVWCFLVLWRYLFRYIFVNVEKQNVVIVGAGKAGKDLYRLLANPLSPYNVIGVLDDHSGQQTDGWGPNILGTSDQLLGLVVSEGIKAAIVPISHERSPRLVRNLIQARLKEGVDLIEMPKVFETLTGSIPVEHIDDRWLLSADGFNLIARRHIWKLKYFGDFCLAIILLILTAPLIAIISLVIRMDSPGPVLFKQRRVGRKGKVFALLKFRSMIEDAEQNGPVWADKCDPRITRIGRLIRFLRLDELPQLINVIRGEMSLIGPRPERSEFVDDLENIIPYYAFRHSVRPGITGWAQVNFRYGASVDDGIRKLEYDLFYIKNMSFILDAKIMLKTLGVVLFGQGAR